MEIVVEGESAANLTRDLRDWIRKERIGGVEAELAPGRPVPDTQGVELVTTLLLFLKTKVADELVSSIKTWLKVRGSSKVKLTFKDGTKQLTLDVENTIVDEKLIQNLRAFITEAA